MKRLIINILFILNIVLFVCVINVSAVSDVIYTTSDDTLTISGTGEITSDDVDANIDECTKVIIKSGITSIGNNAFARTDITEITIPDTVTEIGYNAFARTLLTNVTLPKNLNELKSGVFSESTINSIVIPANVTSISVSTFEDCDELTLVKFEGNTCDMKSSSFKNVGENNEATLILPSTWTKTVPASAAEKWFGGYFNYVMYTYRITYDSNGGSTIPNEEGILTIPNDLPIPERNNYTFLGWYTDEVFNNKVVTGENITKNITLYAKWEKNYTYTFITGKDQEFTISKINNYSFTIDGDFSKFESLTIEDLALIKDTDYIITEGSTVVSFTESGITKLNTLLTGSHNVIIKYSNSKTVEGNIKILDDTSIKEENNKIEEIDNPKTYDKIIIWLILLFISISSMIVSILYLKKHNTNL